MQALPRQLLMRIQWPIAAAAIAPRAVPAAVAAAGTAIAHRTLKLVDRRQVQPQQRLPTLLSHRTSAFGLSLDCSCCRSCLSASLQAGDSGAHPPHQWQGRRAQAHRRDLLHGLAHSRRRIAGGRDRRIQSQPDAVLAARQRSVVVAGASSSCRPRRGRVSDTVATWRRAVGLRSLRSHPGGD